MRRRSKEQEHKNFFSIKLLLSLISFKDDNTIYRLLMTLEIPHTLEFHTQRLLDFLTMTLGIPHTLEFHTQ